MNNDPGRFLTVLKQVHPGALTAEEDAEEIATFFALGKAVYQLAGLGETPTPTFMSDHEDTEHIAELAGKLSSTESRELAYAVSHLLSIVDISIAPAEDAFLASLRSALSIDEERANELAHHMAASITPE
jgi:hypothetical protein